MRQASDIALESMGTAMETENAVAAPREEGILVLDDDPEVVKVVQQMAGNHHSVYWASSLDAGFELLAQHKIGMIVSELFVRRESIALALKMLKAQHPQVVTIVMTSFQDTTALISLINEGQVYRFLPKPVRRVSLGMSITAALRQHRSLRIAPSLARRHTVEQVRLPEDAGLAARVMGYLSRMRGNTLTGARTA